MFSPSNFSREDIWNEFPRLTNLGTSSFGEVANICNDTLDEAIQDGPSGRNIEFKQQIIQELHKLLSFIDEEIDRITQTWVLLSIDPTADV